MKNEKVNINITGEEANKNEIIYNNIVDNLKLTDKDQITYFKNKAINLELEIKNKKLTLLLFLISLVGISFGIYLLIKDFYILGSAFIILTFIGVVLRFYLMFKGLIKMNKISKYERIENLRKLLDSKLK